MTLTEKLQHANEEAIDQDLVQGPIYPENDVSDHYINALEDVYEMIDETINALSLLIFIAPEEDFDYLKSIALLLGRALNTLEVLK